MLRLTLLSGLAGFNQARACRDTFLTQLRREALGHRTFKGTRNRADTVPWDGAATFRRKLTQREDNACRLPTEAEWEYAARGGAAGATGPVREGLLCAGASGPDEVAWHRTTSGEKALRWGRR